MIKTKISKSAKAKGHRKKYGHLTTSTRHPLVRLWNNGISNLKKLVSRHREFRDKSVTIYYTLEINMAPELLELFDIGTNLKEIENIPTISETGKTNKM
jgi:hypothetical protein